MGDVYRAHDSKLGREVALKVLPPEMSGDPDRLGRFGREARAVAALNHPNIVTLYSVENDRDVHYLTMELVEGRTLAEEIESSATGLPTDRLFQLASQVAGAVGAAHSKGITHRDLKPENVMVTPDDRVKVLDFGLAKLSESSGVGELTQMETRAATQEGVVLGTVPYMSPEQVEGKALDARSDVFSLGIVLYEMATGVRPFNGDTQAALISSILRDAPPSVSEVRRELPRQLGRILARCFEKSPQVRYEHAGSLAYELEALRKEVETGPVVSIPVQTIQKSIAVLPFVNRGGNPDDEYFSDGLSEELINGLGKLHDLKVTARGSSFQFRGQDVDVREVGQKLGVETVLEGSVRMAGDRLRIVAQLINCVDGYQIWSERIDSRMEDLFDTQDEIAKAIVGKLQVEMRGRSGDDRFVERGTDNLEAYHFLLRARQKKAYLDESSLIEAIGHLQRALELHTDYAEAYAELGHCYILRCLYGGFPGPEAFPIVRDATMRSLELDPNSSLVRALHVSYLDAYTRDWELAVEEAQVAVSLSPQNVEAHIALAQANIVTRQRDVCARAADRVLELDPLGRYSRNLAPGYLLFGGQNARAERAFLEGLELFPDIFFCTSFCLMCTGRGAIGRQLSRGLPRPGSLLPRRLWLPSRHRSASRLATSTRVNGSC